MPTKRFRLLLLAVFCLSAAAAHADSPGDAWAAARGLLPGNPYVVVGVNLATVKGSTIYQQLFPAILAQAGDAQGKLDDIKTTCNINVVDAVQGAVVAIDNTQKGVIFVSTKGLGPDKIADCLGKVMAKEVPGKKLTASKPDAQGIVEYTASGEAKNLYVGYLPHGVIAFATDAQDRSLLSTWLSGKGANAATPAGHALGSVGTGAAFWMVVAEEKNLAPDVQASMKAIYGQADLAGGNISADFRIVTGSPKEATDLAAYAQKQMDDLKKAGTLPAEAMNIVKSLKIGASGAEVQLKASLPEKEALSFITTAMHK
jgi:hypothetical protein